MAPVHQRPINSLKKAEDLIALKHKPDALELLLSVIFSRKIKNTSLTHLEQIMIKFVDLCVELRKGKFAKEGLHQFKNIVLQVNSQSIEKVINHLLEISEAKIVESKKEALAKIEEAKKASQDDSGKLSCEVLHLKTISLVPENARVEQGIIVPWLKFMWEIYRTSLDILRTSAKLKNFYQNVASRAFAFCREYNRKTDFSRLCDILRQHMSGASKGTKPSHSVSPKDQETVHRYLETRFIQLRVATELQLWQEAFRSIEDINSIMLMSKDPPKPEMMANFYKELADILLIGGNYSFRAEVLIRYYNLMISNSSFTEEEQKKFASKALIAALAAVSQSKSGIRSPVLSKFEENTPRTRRLQNLLQIPQYPTREYLLKEVLSMDLIDHVGQCERKIFDLLETHEKPIFTVKNIKEVFEELIQQDPEYKVYLEPLCQVTLIRLFQHLSKVYSMIKTSTVLKMVSFLSLLEDTDGPMTAYSIEKHIINACNNACINIKIYHRTQCIGLGTDVFVSKRSGFASYSLALGKPEMRDIYYQRVNITKNLAAASLIIESMFKIDGGMRILGDALEAANKSIPNQVEIKNDSDAFLLNNELITRKAAIREEYKLRETNEARIREEKRLERLNEDARLRSLAAERAAAAQRFQPEVPQSVLVTRVPQAPEPTTMTLELSRQLKLLEQPKSTNAEFQKKLKNMAKRVDYFERAYRREEIAYLEKDHEQQKTRFEKTYETSRKSQIELAKAIYASNMNIRKRLLLIKDHFMSLKKKVEEKVELQRAIAEKAYREYVEKEKIERLARYKEQIKEKAQELYKVAEEERREMEENERKRKEELELAKQKQKEQEEMETRREEVRLAAERAKSYETPVLSSIPVNSPRAVQQICIADSVESFRPLPPTNVNASVQSRDIQGSVRSPAPYQRNDVNYGGSGYTTVNDKYYDSRASVNSFANDGGYSHQRKYGTMDDHQRQIYGNNKDFRSTQYKDHNKHQQGFHDKPMFRNNFAQKNSMKHDVTSNAESGDWRRSSNKKS